ncbi:MAG: hypothetical protein U0625_09920 [Phycisphaerales bacterium]
MSGDAGEIRTIDGGTCHVCFAFEMGFAVDLDAGARRIASAARSGLRAGARNAAGADFEPRPLRVIASCDELRLEGFVVRPEAVVTVFDFGALSVRFAIPLEGGAEALVHLARVLAGNAPLREAARAIAQRVTAGLGAAVTRPSVLARCEDYAVYELPPLPGAIDPLEGLPPALLARILRAEPGELSDQERDDAVRTVVSYGRDDVAVVDWNAAVLVDADPQDALAVLEFANTELSEMRYLDDRLDGALAEAYTVAGRAMRGPRILAVRTGAAARAIAELQVDAAALYESVNNALKLLGDQWLARLHGAATRRLRIDEYERSVLRKIEALESTYGKVRDRQTQLRAEILEWIIIALIALEILMAVFARR